MPSAFRIRRLADRDRMRWLELFAGYIDFYGAHVPDEVIGLVWHRLLSESPGEHIGLVAVDEADRAQGLAHLLLHRSTWSPTWYGYLEDLYVDPAARGQGLGRALIEACCREAGAAGATRTYWVTRQDNAGARALYDKVATIAPFVQYRR